VIMTRCAGVVLVVFAVTGCSGGQSDRVFEAADATRVAAVRPVAPDWTWPRAAAEPESDPSASRSSDPLLVELQRRMAPLTESGDAANTWRDNDKLGNLAVGVYGSARDAHEAMAAMNEFSRGWGERSGDVTRDEQVDGLGDEAWRLWVGGSGTQVTYHWRRGNLVVEAHVHCFGSCPSDVDAATRAWVDAIDTAAQVSS
jgi:hypothetical protein